MTAKKDLSELISLRTGENGKKKMIDRSELVTWTKAAKDLEESLSSLPVEDKDSLEKKLIESSIDLENSIREKNGVLFEKEEVLEQLSILRKELQALQGKNKELHVKIEQSKAENLNKPPVVDSRIDDVACIARDIAGFVENLNSPLLVRVEKDMVLGMFLHVQRKLVEITSPSKL